MVTGVNTIMRDSANIYARSSWEWWSGGRILSNRQMGTTERITISNYRAEDPLPSLNVFTIDMEEDAVGLLGQQGGTFAHVLFEEIVIANVSTARTCFSSGQCGCMPATACHGHDNLPVGVPNTISGGLQSAAFNVSSVAFNRVTIRGLPFNQALQINPGLINISGHVFNVTADGVPLA
jgi:hypothetical protein